MKGIRQKPETAGGMVFSIDTPDDLMGLIRYGRDAIERKKMESLLYVWEKLLDRHWRLRIRFGRKCMWFVYKPHGREATDFSNQRFEKLPVLGDGRVEMECGSERR